MNARLVLPGVIAALLIALTSASATPATTPIAFGQNVYGALDNTEVDSLSFEATVGDYITARVLMTEDFGGQYCCCFDQQILILGPSREEVATAVSPTNGNCCACRFLTSIGSVRIESSGMHTIYVSDRNGFGRGRYALYLQRLNNPGRADTLHSGQPYIGNVASSGKVDTYVFYAEAGHRVDLAMQPGAGSAVVPRLELYNPSGLAVAIPNSGEIVYSPLVTGYFTLLASSASTETGVYTLDFTHSTTPARSTTWGEVKARYR